MDNKKKTIPIEEFMQMSSQELNDFLEKDERLLAEGMRNPNESNIDFHGKTIKEMAEEQGLQTLDEVFDNVLKRLGL